MQKSLFILYIENYLKNTAFNPWDRSWSGMANDKENLSF